MDGNFLDDGLRFKAETSATDHPIEYINGLIKEGFGHESSNGIGTAAAVLNGGAGTR
jgi:hypothetical protein